MNATFIQRLEKLLNQYLQLDTESAERFKKLKHGVLKIELANFYEFYLVTTPVGIRLFTEYTTPPDTLIRGTPFSLLRMALAGNQRKQFFSEDVTIAGNLELGQHVIDLFDQLEIDWEEHLAQKIGDAPAHHIGRAIKHIKQWSKNTREILAQDVNEYLHEEIEWFPQQALLQEFFDDIDTLRMGTDRLAAKVKQLQQEIDS